MFDNVILVCTGNMCRSPYAEHALRRKAPNLKISSAGLAAVNHEGADGTAISVANTRGIDLSPHVVTKLGSEAVAEADLILVMDSQQIKELLKRHPQARGKVFKLGMWMGDKDIVDPYRQSSEYFSLVFNEIDDAIDQWLRHLIQT